MAVAVCQLQPLGCRRRQNSCSNALMHGWMMETEHKSCCKSCMALWNAVHAFETPWPL